ncbi:MAG: hypothetical protein LAO79_27090 [Acidobacteriia bacterium]|nr:hypothetical protein [Terriglobia bacterium]
MLKYCAALSLCAGLGLSGDFITGQAARAVIGQTTFTGQNSGGVSGSVAASDTVFGAMGGLAVVNNMLFVSDANRLGMLPINNRVLMFNVANILPQPLAAVDDNTRCPVCVNQASLVLGQPDFATTTATLTRSGMNLPLAVASDGKILAVADTANNRVLIWNSIPTVNGQNADIVLGQPDFTTLGPVAVSASTFRAPQGVWIQNGKVFVADTQNNRVLIWNSIPTKNNQPADLVLGQPNFTSVPQIDQTKSSLQAGANIMLTPVSVTSDGTHLFVTDLGFSRVLIWNTIPTQTNQPADLEVGQVDLVTSIPNNSFNGSPASDSTDTVNKETAALCTVSNGSDAAGNPVYPERCGATMDFPRFALSDGKRLFVADSGNDRVLIWNSIPTQNGQPSDIVIGEPDQYSDNVSSTVDLFTPNLQQSGSDITPTPASLAWDGTNLYVSDPSNYRILVFTPADGNVQPSGVVNAASLAIYALGTVTLGGTVGNAGDKITLTINGTDYSYTEADKDTFDIVLKALADAINQSNNGVGDPNVLAVPQYGFGTLQLVARIPGNAGNVITTAVTLSTNAQLSAVTGGSLSGGAIPSTLAPGTLITINGTNLCDCGTDSNGNPAIVAAPANAPLPTTLAGVQVYIDGIRSPLLMVSNTQINAQVPWELVDTNSSNLYVRVQNNDGSVSVTDAVGLPISQSNPGIFAQSGNDPRPGIVFHGSSFATGTVSVDGSITDGDTATVGIEDRTYTYNVQSNTTTTDTLSTVRDGLIALINANPEEKVIASAAAAYARIRLRAKVPGPDGDGIQISGNSTAQAGGTGTVVLTALNSQLCCAGREGAPVNNDNPAIAGETIYLFTTGMGLACDPNLQCGAGDPVLAATADGVPYNGPAFNSAQIPVFASVGGNTATVVSASLVPGTVGVFKVVLELGSGMTGSPFSQLTISQDIYTSNIVVIPVIQPNPSQ